MMRSDVWQELYVERYYRSRVGWVDGTTEFHQMCGEYISDGALTLELGAGPDNKTSRFLSTMGALLVGLDIDPLVRENRYLSYAVVYDGGQFPFADCTFDVVVSDYVNEHLRAPMQVCSEISRVLRPKGIYLFRTPNILHYVSILSSFLPKVLANWARNKSEDAHAPYATYYRFNSPSKCRRVLRNARFEILELRLIEKEPSYGMKSPLLFYPLMCYERLVNYSEAFRYFRANILCAARKCL